MDETQTKVEDVFGKLEDIKIGSKEETSVVKVQLGTQGLFRPNGYWEKVKDVSASQIDAMKKQVAVEVLCANGATMVLSLPANNKVHPKSNLALWRKTYGGNPAVGQKVVTKVDENGFFGVVLEK